jgi:hypothetical protein
MSKRMISLMAVVVLLAAMFAFTTTASAYYCVYSHCPNGKPLNVREGPGKEYPVIQIGTRSNGAIAGQNFTSLKISSNVKLISENAFMSSSQLETVEIEEGLEEIASFAFWNSGVVSINLPSTLKKIGDYAFSSCVNLESLVIPSSVTEIGEQAFVGCS